MEIEAKKKKRRRLYDGIVRYHDLFGIFLIFDKDLSRPSRFALYYLRILVLITMSALFTQSLDQIQSIIVSILTASFTVVPALIIATLLKCQNKCLQIAGATIFVGMSLLCLYASLTVAALLGLEQSNAWATSYITAFCSNTFMVNPLSIAVKLIIVRSCISGNDTFAKFVQLVIGEELMNFFNQ